MNDSCSKDFPDFLGFYTRKCFNASHLASDVPARLTDQLARTRRTVWLMDHRINRELKNGGEAARPLAFPFEISKMAASNPAFSTSC